jgi:hypothetical protein
MKQLFSLKTGSMKKILFIFAIAAIALAACNRAPKTADAQISVADTLGLAEFKAFKAQQAQLELQAMYAANAKKSVRTVSRPRTTSNSGSLGSESSNNALVAKKKGWSKAAKGAVIGAGTGAVLGAVINKRNRVAGGVIGGVLGGGIGYGIGRGMDKKDGRVN